MKGRLRDYAKFQALIVAVLLFVAFQAQAKPPSEQPSVQPDDYIVYMPANGKAYANQLIDTRKQRTVQVATSSPDEIVVDHFYHWGHFYRAVIPVNHMTQLIGQSMNFTHGKNPAANHLQIRFILDEAHPIRLYPNGGDTGGAPLEIVNDFVYSLEGVGPKGKPWTFPDSLRGNLVKSHRLLSTEEMAYERIVQAHQKVSQVEVTNPHKLALKQKYLETLLHRADTEGLTVPFYLFRFLHHANNCMTNLFDPLDQIAQYGMARPLIASVPRVPVSGITYMKMRGLFAPGVPIKRWTLNDEISLDPKWAGFAEKARARQKQEQLENREERDAAREQRRNRPRGGIRCVLYRIASGRKKM